MSLSNSKRGPRILFFSGGSALKDCARNLLEFTSNSVHLLTPFDSGGSSALLRQAFAMPAIGDIRNRLLALMPHKVKQDQQAARLLDHRLPLKASPADLLTRLDSLCNVKHPLCNGLSQPARSLIISSLQIFRQRMPSGFDLRGACIGNLVLTGTYLACSRQLAPAIDRLSSALLAQGLIRPIVEEDLHLAAQLENNDVLYGQHMITGKERPRLQHRIKQIYLVKNKMQKVSVRLDPELEQLIQQADLICYAMGSFFTSLIATILPENVGLAVSKNPAPKVFIPNTGNDPELFGHSLTSQFSTLLDYLRQGLTKKKVADCTLLSHILLDEDSSLYPGSLEEKHVQKHGIQIVKQKLITQTSQPFLDGYRLACALIQLSKAH